MMAGNPNWWSMNGMHPQLSSHLLYGASSNSPNPSPSPPPHLLLHHPNQDFPVRSSWSQLLMGGIGGGEEEEEEEEESNNNMFQQQQKKVEKYWEQDLNPSSSPFSRIPTAAAAAAHHQFQTTWPRQHHHHPPPPVSSPASSITTFNFSSSSSKTQDHSSECNSTRTGGSSKKARVQHSSAQPALKVRKEKLGERITSLHQIVSPFGKTDTASVLSEAIGYIRFLQSQIEALSSPYMRNAAAAAAHHQHSVQERNCLFPEEPSQFLNDISMEGRGVCKQDTQGRSGMKDLRSRGLCLVPISCTQHVGSDTGADYWAPAAFGGSF